MKKISKFTRHPLGLSISLGSMAILYACGSDSSGGASDWLDTFATSFAISSPTAGSTGSLNLHKAAPLGTEVESDADIATKAELLTAIASGEKDSCIIVLPNLGNLGQRATCYGPSVVYADHADCTGGGCTADGDTTDANGPNDANDTDGDDTLPGGDLGIWDAAEADGTACAAAQLNMLMKSASAYVDASLLMQASAVCVLSEEGTDLPSTGDTVDFTESMDGKITAPSGTPTVTTATVRKSSGGVYEYNFAGTTDGVKEFSFTIKHTPGDEESDYSGVIYGSFNTTNKDAFSVVYNKNSNDVKARLSAGSWNTATADSTIFTADGLMNMGGSFHGNMNHALINANVSTGVAAVSYAWQAGSGDDKTRVFNVFTQAGSSALEGCGYFGYGDAFSNTLSSNTNEIDGFICNWAGVGNDHSMSSTANWAQKQCFTQNSTNGIFEENTSKRKIRYWPTVACNKGGGTMDLTPDPDHNAGGAATANDLVQSISGDTDFADYTTPIAPTL